MSAQTVYTYCFFVYPHTKAFKHRDIFNTFAGAQIRTEMLFTEEAFRVYRQNMSEDGFTLREIERWPYHESESVK